MRAGRPSAVTTSEAHSHNDRPGPQPDNVEVWVAHLDPEPGESARRVAATNVAERERASRFYRREDAERYLSAHGALRLLLAEYLACDPVALRLASILGEWGMAYYTLNKKAVERARALIDGMKMPSPISQSPSGAP